MQRIFSATNRRVQPVIAVVATLGAALAFAAGVNAQSNQLYTSGDIVPSDLSFTERGTGKTVTLTDFEGKIVLLDWFAYWCPFCAAAAPEIEKNIVNHYDGQNIHGVPFMHVAVNLQSSAEKQTQDFIDAYSIQYVVEDFDRAVANKFATSNQPIFAIINCVANTPDHQQYELLYSHLGYLSYSTPTTQMRAAIDSVQTPLAVDPPTITSQPEGGQRVATNSSFALHVTASGGDTLTYQWKRDNQEIVGATSADLTFAAARLQDAGEYTVTVTNSGGSATSEAATVEVVTSFADYLTAAGVPSDQANPDDDPDGDTVSNAFEYIAQTDPMDPTSQMPITETIAHANGAAYIDISYPALAGNTIGITVETQFATSPSFANAQSGVATSSNDQSIETVRSPTPIEASAPVFTRLVATLQ